MKLGLPLLVVTLLGSVSGCALSPSMACASGNAVSCALLGDRSFRGGQEGADLGAAQGYFEKSCQRGFLPGCHGLGLVEREQKRLGEASELLEDTCKKGYGPACSAAGDLQRTRSPELAARFYAAACKWSDAEGCLQLALLEEQGVAGEVDPDEVKSHYGIAMSYYRSRCQAGYGASCYRYAEFYARGWGTDANDFQVRRLMEKSCALGHAPACEYDASAR